MNTLGILNFGGGITSLAAGTFWSGGTSSFNSFNPSESRFIPTPTGFGPILANTRYPIIGLIAWTDSGGAGLLTGITGYSDGSQTNFYGVSLDPQGLGVVIGGGKISGSISPGGGGVGTPVNLLLSFGFFTDSPVLHYRHTNLGVLGLAVNTSIAAAIQPALVQVFNIGNLFSTSSESVQFGFNAVNQAIINTTQLGAGVVRPLFIGANSNLWGFTTSGNFTPTVDATQNLGTPALRVAEIVSSLNTVVTAQLDKTNDTALASLTFNSNANLASGGRYTFHIILLTASAAAGGVKVDLGGGTATATATHWDAVGAGIGQIGDGGTQTSLTTAVGITSSIQNIDIHGDITVNLSGTLIPRFAQNVGNGTPSSVLAGSWMKITRVS